MPHTSVISECLAAHASACAIGAAETHLEEGTEWEKQSPSIRHLKLRQQCKTGKQTGRTIREIT